MLAYGVERIRLWFAGVTAHQRHDEVIALQR